jgi:CRP-like cAMP-binding protein
MKSVREINMFNGLDGKALAALDVVTKEVILAPGETLYKQGDTASGFYIVVRGGVRLVEHTPEGKDLNLKVYGPGDAFGLLAIAGEYPHPAAVIAASPSVLLRFDGDAVRDLITRHPTVGLCIIDALVDHVHHAHDRIRQMALEKTERRLARALLHFAEKFGQQNPDGHISANFTQQDIAEFTGTTVETVSRFFKQWEQQGYIKRDRSSVTLLSSDGLRGVVDEDGKRGMGYHLM